MVIVGDGIGPDIVPATVKVLEATGINFEFEYYDAGDETLEKTGKALPDETLDAARKSEVILKGPIGESAKEVVLPLRQELDLYANLRPAKTLPGIETRLKPGEKGILEYKLKYKGILPNAVFEYDGNKIESRFVRDLSYFNI